MSKKLEMLKKIIGKKRRATKRKKNTPDTQTY